MLRHLTPPPQQVDSAAVRWLLEEERRFYKGIISDYKEQITANARYVERELGHLRDELGWTKADLDAARKVSKRHASPATNMHITAVSMGRTLSQELRNLLVEREADIEVEKEKNDWAAFENEHLQDRIASLTEQLAAIMRQRDTLQLKQQHGATISRLTTELANSRIKVTTLEHEIVSLQEAADEDQERTLYAMNTFEEAAEEQRQRLIQQRARMNKKVNKDAARRRRLAEGSKALVSQRADLTELLQQVDSAAVRWLLEEERRFYKGIISDYKEQITANARYVERELGHLRDELGWTKADLDAARKMRRPPPTCT
ncbi:unnamed protein product [Vitrella brassicaformis CCMP3155]|uniref:Uncharacterized protein n=1 Tax=Vitrella brassicaformis (strain CCMP3155) TaxID=1169540 RepID=A0A0G4GPP7_VITBC|nr:unnamed protein product [Vitrella brassicaformis CCMP3155]|eukprot:CEM32262.1 unnamed protein product [Vitrella brassicaformis CCMP3155]